jgi:hypothetical protein
LAKASAGYFLTVPAEAIFFNQCPRHHQSLAAEKSGNKSDHPPGLEFDEYSLLALDFVCLMRIQSKRKKVRRSLPGNWAMDYKDCYNIITSDRKVIGGERKSL